jgi:hypothetical protein
MKIKINDTNREAITAALLAANGKATAHTFTSASEVVAAKNNAEAQLTALELNKGERAGVVAYAVSGGSLQNAYKYSRTITRVTLLRGSSDWFLTDAKSYDSWQKKAGEVRVTLTCAQAASVVAKFSTRFSVNSAA